MVSLEIGGLPWTQMDNVTIEGDPTFRLQEGD
jgi:hypothetical protein